MEEINEGIIPMNFNWRQTMDNQSNYNPMINMNDPIVAAEYNHRIKQQQASAKYQQIEIDRSNANKVLNKLVIAIENLLNGNSRKGFSYNDSLILLNSIKNKSFELLTENKLLINNDIITEQVGFYEQLYLNQYSQDCLRYKLEYSSNSISFNTENGIVKFNPHGLYDIVLEWVNAHQTHQKIEDKFIFG